MNRTILSTIIILIEILFIVLFLPTNTKSFNDTYIQQILFAHGSINFLKLPILLISALLINFGISNIKKNVIFIIFFILLSFSLFLLLPSHCPIGLCYYTNPINTDLSNIKYSNFFGLGDIQNLHHVRQSTDPTHLKWHNRVYATELYIESINKFTEKIKNKDLTNINIESLSEENKILFLNIIKENILGVISVGDCTQLGNNIGSITGKNDVGAYEYAFNNNPTDNGLLNIPSFEVLGNHDYDILKDTGGLLTLSFLKKLLLFEGNPLVNMQLRRNKKRQFITNKDKYGNYALDFGDLHIIFINVWPSRERLLNGDSTGSLEFLENDLKQNKNKSWMFATHYMPTVKSSFDELINKNDKPMKYLEEFGKIYEKYKDNCLGVIYGHNHVRQMRSFNNLGLQHYNVPGPASYLSKIAETRESINRINIEIPLFSFLKKEKILKKFKINIIKNKNILKFNITSY
tara:strand:- start:1281 stop:2666 length:1386 start_codon:yes stop_codon:yes gene_type:complete